MTVWYSRRQTLNQPVTGSSPVRLRLNPPFFDEYTSPFANHNRLLNDGIYCWFCFPWCDVAMERC
jgi:hypothetical protein